MWSIVLNLFLQLVFPGEVRQRQLRLRYFTGIPGLGPVMGVAVAPAEGGGGG